MPTTVEQGVAQTVAARCAKAITNVGQQLVLNIEFGDLPTTLFAVRQVPKPSEAAASVAAFHRAFGLPARSIPGSFDLADSLLSLRTSLLDEEATEFACAAAQRDLIGMADALADVVYVCYGTALTLGVDLDAVIREVHRANMSKLDADGRPVMRDDGKVLKSPRYTPPDVARVLADQLALPFYDPIRPLAAGGLPAGVPKLCARGAAVISQT